MNAERIDRGCTCFICPPCNFCTDMSEAEVEAYLAGGESALRRLNYLLEEDETAIELELFVLTPTLTDISISD